MNKAETEEKGEQEKNSYITYIFYWFLYLYIFRTWIKKYFSKMFFVSSSLPSLKKKSGSAAESRKINKFRDITIDAEGLQYLGYHGLWVGRDFYRATSALARSLVIFGAVRRNAQYSTTPTHKGNLLWLRIILSANLKFCKSWKSRSPQDNKVGIIKLDDGCDDSKAVDCVLTTEKNYLVLGALQQRSEKFNWIIMYK